MRKGSVSLFLCTIILAIAGCGNGEAKKQKNSQGAPKAKPSGKFSSEDRQKFLGNWQGKYTGFDDLMIIEFGEGDTDLKISLHATFSPPSVVNGHLVGPNTIEVPEQIIGGEKGTAVITLDDDRLSLEQSGLGHTMKGSYRKDDNFAAPEKVELLTERSLGSVQEILKAVYVKAELSRHRGTIQIGDKDYPQPLKVKLSMLGDAASKAISFGKLQLEAIVDGKPLERIKTIGTHDQSSKMISISRSSKPSSPGTQPNDRLEFIEHFAYPKDAKKIESLKGQLLVNTGGRTKIARVIRTGLGVVKHSAFRLIRMQIVLDKDEFNNVNIRILGDTPTITSVKLNEAGKQSDMQPAVMEVNGSKTYSFNFEAGVPEKFDLEIKLREGSIDGIIPIDLVDLSLEQ